MESGFLNTPQPGSFPAGGPELSLQVRPSSPPRVPQDGDDKAATTENMYVEKKTLADSEDITRSAMILSTEDVKALSEPNEANGASAEAEQNKIEADPKGNQTSKTINTGGPSVGTTPPGDPQSSEHVTLTRSGSRLKGQGRDPQYHSLHTVPKSHGGPDQKRAVFRVWPRRPDGKPIVPTKELMGTLSPDGYPWGATLYDFYNVNTAPGDQSAMSHMTGSALSQAMKALGEDDVAAQEIEWASSESIPRDEGAAKLELSIMGIEEDVRQVALGRLPFLNWSGEDGSGWTIEKAKREKEDEPTVSMEGTKNVGGNNEGSNDEEYNEDEASDDMDVDPASILPLQEIPVSSPFHPSHYPKPWPFVPFEKPVSIRLQECIPSYLFPQTLYVHDPFDLLSARDRQFQNTSWSCRTDVVRTYHIRHSKAANKDPEEERQKAESLEDFKARKLIVLRYKRTEEQIKNYEPVIEVSLPPHPRRTTRVEESHLYLSPVAKVGEGHHSIVYKAEWELPRDLFVGPKFCLQCFQDSVDEEIQRLKVTGEWEKLLRAAGWDPTGSTGRQPTQTEVDQASGLMNPKRDGVIIDQEIVFSIRPHINPFSLLESLDDCDAWKIIMNNGDMKTITFNLCDSSDEDNSNVAVIRVNPPVSYESSRMTCKHDFYNDQVPRTTRFTVIAKLSLENDHHLLREARNYQQFPKRFFCHYDGYTLIDQLHSIVPVHAIVPQFYGHYIPQVDENEESYLSPILLLENCGDPIVPEMLSLEDQEECVSMLLRFHRAGWLHESVFPRNILVQKGMPTELPAIREFTSDLSFRLIDFGRSREYEEEAEKREEELTALKMLQKLQGKMSVTPVSPPK